MKKTNGYVAATEDGRFLIVDIITKWGNDSVYVGITNDIEAASIFPHPSISSRIGRLPCTYPSKMNFLPVEIRREVILLGYGTPTESLF